MQVYSATREQFSKDVLSNCIEDKILAEFRRKAGYSTSKSEILSWKNSLQYINNVLMTAKTPGNAGVSIEYKIPQSSKRIDFILTGKNNQKKDTAVIIELKQWQKASYSEKDGIVKTFLGKSEREVEHPSYQAWTYAALLYDFNETVREENIGLKPCTYLHNCESYDVIKHSHYKEYTEKAPAFLKNESARLAKFIQHNVKYGDAHIMYRIENGKISPSKHLSDSLLSMLQGNREFIMIDDQKLVYETALQLCEESKGQKQVLIVEGGPGTGKSVVAVNLLVEFTKRKKVVQYVTKNSAPRTVYESKLTGTFKKSHISNLFKSSGSYIDCEPDCFDVLVVDEAHRLNAKSGLFQNKGENQIKEIIQSSRLSVFFIDEDQQVTLKDIGEKHSIIEWANNLGAKIHEMQLASQFRCNGSDGYLAWLDNILQIRQTANEDISEIDYDFQVVDSPNELRDLILRKNKRDNKARLVAGYCWPWISKKSGINGEDDILLPEYDFSMKWNLNDDGSLWLLKPNSVNEIGCIHTCQGLELDYVGVIIGPDLIVREGIIITKPEERAGQDRSIHGYKKLLKEKPVLAKQKVEKIIKNTYRTLMSRGQKGCYIFCVDPETNAYFKSLLKEKEKDQEQDFLDEYSGLDLQVFAKDQINPYVDAVPVFDLKIAASHFSEHQPIESWEWVVLPEYIKPSQGMFLARVVGESMNKRIPNGSWCLFRQLLAGTRNGKIVLAQHRDIYDEDTGGKYTIKRYFSEKVMSKDGEWQHEKIILRPETTVLGYDDIVITGNDLEEFKIIAEFVMVL